MRLRLIEGGAGPGKASASAPSVFAARLRFVLGRGDGVARPVELGMRLLRLLAQSLGGQLRRLGSLRRRLKFGFGFAARACALATSALSPFRRRRSISRAPAALSLPALML